MIRVIVSVAMNNIPRLIEDSGSEAIGARSGIQDVDAYIAAAPAPAQPLLRTLRAIVKSEAPSAEEGLSYGMPYYEYHGRLAYFAVHKTHIGVYGLAGRGDVPGS